ncbi:hypothetical protein [Halorussus marinus]|uniref:hypothetical protein n=1 Tax=Halorussus marinus TaxID=2505976 RepID=UPI00106E2600|nr:hypothetical protein [Halorussus marinus]
MSSDLPTRALESIVTDKFYKEQSDVGTRRYVPYSFTQGLRKAMGHLNADNIQELDANRSFNTGRDNLAVLSNSTVSEIFNGEEVSRKQFELSFDRGEHGSFPWSDVRSNLGQSTIYDLPVRRIVVRFSNEEFEKEWKETIESAINIDDFPTSWIEPPFFAVLESTDPGDSDARENVKNLHEEFYFKPKFRSDEDFDGMDWSIQTLDLQSVWSYQGFVNRPEPILTTRAGDRQYEWTPRRMEKFLMNFFHPEEDYTGVIRNSEFAGLWRRIYSRDVTSTKEFAWEEDEEWVQTE